MNPTPRPLPPRSQAALDAFLARLAEHGATLIEPQWLGVDRPHRVRCAQGHDCTPRPKDVATGGGICRACAGQDPRTAESAFRARLAELGATLLEATWLGNKTRHRVRCVQGHDCAVWPSSVDRGRGVCRTCAGSDPKTAEAAFRVRLEEIGATLLEPTWLGNQTSHRVRCAKGHHCTPRPTNVMSGQGICSICAGAWDVLYVVADQWSELVKVGITSGDPRPRLGEHRRQLGLDQVVRLLTGLPDGAAYQLEQTVLVALRDAGVYPVWGKETFYAPRALRRMLDLVDGYRPMSERHPE